MHKVRYFVLITSISLLFLMNTREARAADVKEEDSVNSIDYSDIQDVINDTSTNMQPFDFKEYVTGLVKGEEKFSFGKVFSDIKNAALSELSSNRKTIYQLVVIAIVAAIFTNFSNIFKNNQIADTSFYVTYIFMFSILTASFVLATNIAINVLNGLLTFMKVLVPTYMVSIAFCTGSRTSMMYYESTLVVIGIIDFVLIKVLIPLINVYFVLMLANNLSKEDMMSKMTELIQLIINWTMKSLLAVVIGMNAIQGLIYPSIDHIKNSLLLKSVKSIPGLGTTINSVSEMIIGTSVVVKNAIGVGGLVVIMMICIVPVIKLAFYSLMYKFGTAIVQPISDKRIINSINAASQGARMLLTTVILSIVMFLISIAIIATSTNVNLT